MINTKLLYGGDYYPEQWLDKPDILEKDIEFLKKAKMNVISLGVFAWSILEPKENEFYLDWLEEIVNKLYENGIYIMLATPSGARPKWLSDKYPEVLRTNQDRTKNLFGARHNHCYTSKIYREKVRIINTKLAERFADNKAVVLWHISNEYSGECHCPLCQEAFRNWLKDRYKDIEVLNEKWWTTFWSHKYDSFEQIESPSTLGEKAVHALNLDWRRFVTYQTADFIKAEIKSLRDAGAKQPSTTNLMYDFRELNYLKIAEEIDIVSWDTYPLWHKYNDIDVARDTGMQHDYMRCLKHKPFLIMESCPSSTNWQDISKLKKPGLLLNASLQAIAHGSNSVQYFQIRQSRGSSEKFHGAVIDHYGGDDTRVFKEIMEVGKTLEMISETANSETISKVALIYDVENRWAMEDAQGPRNKGLYYHEAAMKSYNALKKYGLNVDVIDMEQKISEYSVVVAPMLYMFRANIQSKLRDFVAKGGTLIMTYWSGIVDETDLCHIGGTPAEMIDVLGLRFEEIDGLYDWEQNSAVPFSNNFLNIDNKYTCTNICELVKVNEADVLMVYGSDFYKDRAVLTHNKYNDGEAYYIGADMEQAFYDDIYAKILQKNNIEKILDEIPNNVDVNCKKTKDHEYIFIQNYGEQAVKLELPKDSKVVCGQYKNELAGMSTIVVKK